MADTNGLDDEHGFFQFAGGSESDSDDGLFVAARDRKRAFDVSQIDYTPQIDEDAWFDCSDDKPVASWIAEHTGLEQITYTVQHMYFGRRYGRAASLCKQAVAAYTRGKNVRVANIREIIDVGARAAIHDGDLELAGWFYDWYLKCGGMNPGYNSFQAYVLTRLGRMEEALEQHVLYLEQRRQDAEVWESIGAVLVSLHETFEDRLLLRLALGSFCRSFAIIHGCKNWRDTEIAVRRKRIQVERLWQAAINSARLLSLPVAADDLSLADDGAAWQKLNDGVSIEPIPPALDSYSASLAKSLSWVATQLSAKQPSDGAANDADDEKNVTEL
ncbi:hypothetical protein H4S02_001328 [Coemansia sp. RSA 2611]|nr:hypothetical protein IWW54_000625 [Coemansia sp. RSA 2705]KAJ2322024.1 hypothetical protein IWW52_000359 [Coemansia sp. RSA 2704]KAJ2370002.1 hypothetical protein H4S01_000655 [Coemansia sp. RSA 2610]KAJ2391445.1 hypothetical protein H4S02_001328 [Coemansia sp. RSA 2611]KAJ2739551.1 hypothetical protein H4R23_000381 [Coemansia sp. Cherry 401B]